ncbi:hypothetical protein AAE478_005747 [Parahypoxylon ruwenzoriense]
MAVLDGFPGVQVTIRINGVDCVEYDDPDVPNPPSDRSMSSKYIESLDDTEFAIYARVDDSYKWASRDHLLTFYPYVDGKSFYGETIWSSGSRKDLLIKSIDEPCGEDGSWFRRKLKFSAVKIVEDTTKKRVEADREVAKRLGVIEVDVFRCIDSGRSDWQPCSYRAKDSFELAEKSLKGKGISHGTVCNFFDFPVLREDNDRPIATFRFYYRSKSKRSYLCSFLEARIAYHNKNNTEALQQELIIPSAPFRSPMLDGLSEEERDRLARERLDQMKAEKSIKKDETPEKKRKYRKVVDLTSDDESDRSVTLRASLEVIDLTED